MLPSNQNGELEKYWKKLWSNVNMSSKYGAAGARELKNPKLQGRVRKSNQSTAYHEVSITIDDLKEQWEKQNGKCYWLRIDMSLEDLMISRSPFAVSVDRLDSNGHYTKDNIVLTTRFANLGRGAYAGEDFQERLDKLLADRI